MALLATSAMLVSCTSASARVGDGAEVYQVDEEIPVVVSGLEPGAEVTVEVTDTDMHDVQWASSAVFEADEDGTVDTSRHAPVDGPYDYPSAYGLLDTLTPVDETGGVQRFALDDGTQALHYQVASAGSVIAERDVVRNAARLDVMTQSVTLEEAGFAGEYFSPAGGADESKPAVLIISGSGGGMAPTWMADALAERGFPAMAIAYFNYPGLPEKLHEIPLEYFATAAQWLASSSGADSREVVAWGISRGGEAAQLVGLNWPEFVTAVAATVPSSIVGCSLGVVEQGRRAPAWSLAGEGLSCGSTSTDSIPLGDFGGPVYLACGGRDQIWPSCAFVGALAEELQRREPPPPGDIVLSFPSLGHEVGGICGFGCSTGQLWGPYEEQLEEPPIQEAWREFVGWLDGIAAA